MGVHFQDKHTNLPCRHNRAASPTSCNTYIYTHHTFSQGPPKQSWPHQGASSRASAISSTSPSSSSTSQSFSVRSPPNHSHHKPCCKHAQLTSHSNCRRRPSPPLPNNPQTRLPHHAARMVHHNVRRPLLHGAAGMVQHVHVHGIGVPCASVVLGDWGFD